MKLSSVRTVAFWVCETHLRELEDLIEGGEYSEAGEVWAEGRAEWRGSCLDCRLLSGEKVSA
jgi:hypothetical protein